MRVAHIYAPALVEGLLGLPLGPSSTRHPCAGNGMSMSAFALRVPPWLPRFRPQSLHLCAPVSCSWCVAIHRVGGIPTAGTPSADMSSRASRPHQAVSRERVEELGGHVHDPYPSRWQSPAANLPDPKTWSAAWSRPATRAVSLTTCPPAVLSVYRA